MKLSEAIRLGSMGSGQAFGVTERNGHTCALGAALFAIGELKDEQHYHNVLDHFPISREYVADPITGEHLLVLSIIRILNDEHRWTRPRIAEWVQSIEDAHVPAQESATSQTVDAVVPVVAANG